jgi:hypothetical protein
MNSQQNIQIKIGQFSRQRPKHCVQQTSQPTIGLSNRQVVSNNCIKPGPKPKIAQQSNQIIQLQVEQNSNSKPKINVQRPIGDGIARVPKHITKSPIVQNVQQKPKQNIQQKPKHNIQNESNQNINIQIIQSNSNGRKFRPKTQQRPNNQGKERTNQQNQNITVVVKQNIEQTTKSNK